MGRPRTSTKQHLPAYVREKNGRYYLEPKGPLKESLEGKSSLPLGKSYPGMLAEYARLTRQMESSLVSGRDIRMMNELIDEFMFSVRPAEVKAGYLAASTYNKELSKVKTIRSAFGHFAPSEIEKVHIYEFIDWRSETAPIGVNRDLSLLARILQYGERLGLLKQSPCVNIRRNKESGRSRYITDAEYQAFRSFAQEHNPLVAAYMDFKYVTGLRVSDILKLTRSKLREDGIECYIHKNKQHKIMEWSSALRVITQRLIDSNWKPIRGTAPYSIFLMHNRKGQKYSADGWRSIFYRLMKKACDEGVLEEPFCDHDIRAKAGSDANSVEEAAKFLVHLNIRVTQKHYRRKPDYIQPLL